MSESGGDGWVGRAGLLAGVLLWAVSVPVLAALMRALATASVLGGFHALRGTASLIMHQHAAAVLWSLLFALLQIASMLVIAFTLRASYHLRTAVCFTVGAAVPLVCNGFSLFALLVCLRLLPGAR